MGTGALALPKAFLDAGWLVTGIALAVTAFMRFVSFSVNLVSYVPATFIIESMSLCNATGSSCESVLTRLIVSFFPS